MTNKEALDRVFMPRSVAIAGGTPREPGELVFETLLASGFRGDIYFVGSGTDEVSGRKAYRSLSDIPGPVDYVLCCTPAAEVLPFLRECAARRVGAVAILTAGFSESGTPEGIKLEREIAALAQSGGLRVIGPNCLGVYCPRSGMSFDSRLPTEGGRVGFICQGSEVSVHIIRAAGHRGVRFSKAVSCGNGCDVNESDILEYYARDDETKIVAIYVDGVRSGSRFCGTLAETTKTKPVVVLNGGDPSAGAKAPASHTVSAAGSEMVWGGLMQQVGAISVHSLDEIVDVLVTLSLLPTPHGRRVAIVGAGGGAAVLGADHWAENGFVLPPLPPAIRKEIERSVPQKAGLMLHNPIDLSMFAYGTRTYQLIKTLMNYEAFADLSVLHIGFGQAGWVPSSMLEADIDFFKDAIIRLKGDTDRPLALVMQYLVTGWDWRKGLEDLQQGCAAAGLPVYHSMASAAKAVDKVLLCHERRRETATHDSSTLNEMT